MPARRNLILGVALAAGLVVPTLSEVSASAESCENSIAEFAAARSQIETRISASARTLGTGLVDWAARELAGL